MSASSLAAHTRSAAAAHASASSSARAAAAVTAAPAVARRISSRGPASAAAAAAPLARRISSRHRPGSVSRAAAADLPSPSSSRSGAPQPPPPAPVVAVEGDVVRVHWSCRDATTGATLECSRGGGSIVATAPGAGLALAPGADSSSDREDSEPLTFEVGAGDTQANPIFEAFDDAVRGLAVGERAEIEAEGGAWDPARLFTVPREHEEVQRLEGRYKK